MSIENLFDIAKIMENENADYKQIYNRLVKICDSIMNIDEFQFDLSKFSAIEIKNFLKFFLFILDSNNDKLFNKKTKNPNRKLIYNLGKNDMDIYLDNIIKDFLKRGYDEKTNKSFVPNFDYGKSSAELVLNRNKSQYRQIIRRGKNSPNEKVSNIFSSFMDNYLPNISQLNDNKNKGIYNQIEALYVIYVALETFSDILMQTILYLVIDNSKLSEADKKNMMKKLVIQSEKFLTEYSPKSERALSQNIFISFGIYLFYLEQRNRYKTEEEIMKLLMEQMKSDNYIMDVPDKYKCNQRYLENISVKKELREIILEGKEEKEERFNKRFADAQYLITFLASYTGRELDAEYLQHIKVVYREIIEDSLEYNGVQSRSILRRLKNDTSPYIKELKDIVFIREKISRGLLREKGYAEFYLLKNQIQINYYETVLKAFSCYDEIRIAKDLKRVYSGYKKMVLELLT